jgi:putative ABC transport system ATP-binding protein
MDKPVLIEARQASLLYQDGEQVVQAVREVSLRVHRGEFIGIEGPSGSGKSSLLYLLSGLKMPTTGTVTYQGRRYTEMSDAERSAIRRTRFGFVFRKHWI